MTDVPSRQDSSENDDSRSSAEDAQGTPSRSRGTQTREQGRETPQDVPQWSAEQPAPAPWFLGRPGPVPPGFPPPPPQAWQQGPLPPAPPLPPPTPDQAAWPDQAPGTRPEHGQGQGQGEGQAQGQPWDRVPPWTGQLPPNPERPNGGPGHGAGQPGPAAQAGPQGQGGQRGPGAYPPQPQQPPQPPPGPWPGPDQYTQEPGRRPPLGDPRSGYRPQRQQQREDPQERPPLSLRTRWARGLALGGALCTLITLLNGYRHFPAWLIGAVVALAMSMGGLWLGAFAQRDATRKSQRAPEAVASVVWSGISTLIAVAIVAFSLIFYPQLRDYSDCMRSANTIAGEKSCQQQFDNSMTFKP